MVLHAGSPHERAVDAVDAGGLPVEAVLETVLERSGVGVVVFDADVRFRMVNEAAAAINGLPVADHLGRRLADVLPELAAAVEPMVREVFRTGVPTVGAEVTGVTPAAPGAVRSWVVSFARVPDGDGRPGGVVLVFSETTAIRRAEQRLRDVIDGLFSFVAVLDPHGTVVEVNQTVLAVSGVTAGEVVGRPFWDGPWWTYDPAVRERMRDAVVRAAAGSTIRFDVEARVLGDERLPIDFQVVPLVEDGSITALVPSGIDISDRVRAERRARASAQLARSLAGASTTPQIVAAVADQAAAAVSAAFAGVVLVDEDGTLALAGGGPAGRSPAGTEVSLDDVAVAVAAALRRPGTVHLAGPGHTLPAAASAAVALQHPDGSAFGALIVRWDPGSEPVQADLDDLQALAGLVAQAIARSRLADAHLELAQELRATLLGEVVAHEALDVATAYVPASAQLNFGGDWHDVIDLGGGLTAFIIGDVVGHGVLAAARMARFHTVIDTLVRQGIPLAEVFRRTQGLLAHIDTGFVATAALAVVDATAETLTYVSAGHPPLVVRHPDGTVAVLEDGRQPVIGCIADDVPPVRRPFPGGSTLVLYTDGLVERTGSTFDEGVRVLTSTLADAPPDLDAAALSERLVAEGADRRRRDDIAVIVVTHRGTAAADPHGARRRRFPASTAAVGDARRFVAGVVGELPPVAAHTLATCVSEAAANAVHHAGTAFTVLVVPGTDSVRVEVADASPAVPAMGDGDPSTPGGRGLRIIDALARRWGVDVGVATKVVWFEVAVDPDPPGS